MRTPIAISLILCLLISTASAQKNVWNYTPPKAYVVYKTSEALIMDGKASEKAWDQAPWTDYYVDIEGDKKPKPYYKTRMKMLWDDTYMYFYVELEEPHIWGNLTQHDDIIFHNNDFEIFIRPNLEETHYAEFEINALGTVWDLLLLNTYRAGAKVINRWHIDQLKTGIDIQGTLNNPSDIDTAWHIELALPWSSLKEMNGGLPKDGEQWRINFSRVQWKHQITKGIYEKKVDENGKHLPEHNWVWSPQGVINMHAPEHWGYAQFSTRQAGQAFKRDPYELLEQSLFYLYRLQLEAKKNKGTYQFNTKALLGNKKLIVNGQQLFPSIKSTHFGYEIKMEHQGKSMAINQDGKVKRLK